MFPVPADSKVQLGFRHISAGARQPNYLAFLHLLPPHHVKRVRMSIGSHPTAAMGDEHQAAEQFYFIACISDYALCCGEDRRTLGGLYNDAFIELSADDWDEGRQYRSEERGEGKEWVRRVGDGWGT